VQRLNRECARERETLDAKYEQQQKEQAEQKAAAVAAAAAAGGGGPGGRDGPLRGEDGAGRRPRGGRGRGRGRGGFGSIGPTTASGPFALGSVFSGRQKVMAERGVVPGGSSGVKRSLSYKARKKSEEVMMGSKADYSSSDESDGQRMDVEYISLLDEEDDDDEGKAMETDWGAGAPIRIPRREHVDRQAMVNTDASSKKGKAELKAMKEKEMTFETEIKVKDEPVDDDGIMLLPKRKVKVSESPEVRRKDANWSPTSRRRRRSSSSRRKPVITTAEEKEELEREEADRVFALNELGGELPDVKVKAVDTDGDVNMVHYSQATSNTNIHIY
jgi:DNA-directed RNA polymerase III subunit RPC4